MTTLTQLWLSSIKLNKSLEIQPFFSLSCMFSSPFDLSFDLKYMYAIYCVRESGTSTKKRSATRAECQKRRRREGNVSHRRAHNLNRSTKTQQTMLFSRKRARETSNKHPTNETRLKPFWPSSSSTSSSSCHRRIVLSSKLVYRHSLRAAIVCLRREDNKNAKKTTYHKFHCELAPHREFVSSEKGH